MRSGTDRSIAAFLTTTMMVAGLVLSGYVMLTRASDNETPPPADKQVSPPQVATPTPTIPAASHSAADAAVAALGPDGSGGRIIANVMAGRIAELVESVEFRPVECAPANKGIGLGVIGCDQIDQPEGTIVPMVNIGEVTDFYVAAEQLQELLSAALRPPSPTPVFIAQASDGRTLLGFAGPPRRDDVAPFDIAGLWLEVTPSGRIDRVELLSAKWGPQQRFQLRQRPGDAVLLNDVANSPGERPDERPTPPAPPPKP